VTPDLLSRSLKLLRQHPPLILLGLGMSLAGIFSTGWRLWLAQFITLDFAQLTNLQSIESLLSNSEVAQMQQLLLRGLLLGFGQFVLVWLLALAAEAGLIAATLASQNLLGFPTTAVSQHTSRPITLRQTIRWGQQWLGRFLAIDLIVFFPWFLIALIMFAIFLVLAFVLAGFASKEVAAGTILATTGVGLTCLLGLALLLLPVGMASFWFRLLAFREAILHKLAAKTAVRQTWQRIKQNLGDIFALILILWGGQTLLLNMLNFVTSPLLTWLAQLTVSDTITLQMAAWLAVVLVTLLLWLLRGLVTAVVAIAWTLAYQDLQS
jgi:hypothetical protein